MAHARTACAYESTSSLPVMSGDPCVGRMMSIGFGEKFVNVGPMWGIGRHAAESFRTRLTESETWQIETISCCGSWGRR